MINPKYEYRISYLFRILDFPASLHLYSTLRDPAERVYFRGEAGRYSNLNNVE